MIVGIDASNIRTGGGVTHLAELLKAATPGQEFVQVIVWSGSGTLNRIEDRPWLVKSHQPILDRSLPYRVFWQHFKLSDLARSAGCDLLFVPGGSHSSDFHPMVAMSQNLLPFEWSELRRYGKTLIGLKMALLRGVQSRTFREADGVIHLTRYARDVVMRVVIGITGKTVIIPHGIERRFFAPPREQLGINRYSIDRPFRILYVSIVDVYKHQWHAADAVAQLRHSGLPVVLDLVGPAYPPALARLKKTLDRVDPAGEFVRYLGAVPNDALHARYALADLFLFASSCETISNILLEGMASGLPIACSSRGPMPEILGNSGVYFDPENPDDIAQALRKLIEAPELRARLAKGSSERAESYSWQRCARETFAFLREISRAHGRKSETPQAVSS